MQLFKHYLCISTWIRIGNVCNEGWWKLPSQNKNCCPERLRKLTQIELVLSVSLKIFFLLPLSLSYPLLMDLFENNRNRKK